MLVSRIAGIVGAAITGVAALSVLFAADVGTASAAEVLTPLQRAEATPRASSKIPIPTTRRRRGGSQEILLGEL